MTIPLYALLVLILATSLLSGATAAFLFLRFAPRPKRAGAPLPPVMASGRRGAHIPIPIPAVCFGGPLDGEAFAHDPAELDARWILGPDLTGGPLVIYQPTARQDPNRRLIFTFHSQFDHHAAP